MAGPDYSDLDRAWVINGEELKRALRGMGMVGPNPNTVTPALLERAGAIQEHPDDVVDAHVCCEHAGQWTVHQIAAALEHFNLVIRNNGGVRIHGEVDDPDVVAKVLHGTLTRMAELRDGVSEDAAVLNESIRSGVPLQVDDDEAAAIATCDPEVYVLSSVAELLDTLPVTARHRVLRWACDRYGVETC